ncbi:hypothetical protein BDA96_03G287000 [Sorghum bicolor]|uniref:Ribosomal protein L30 N-terminal domain-containing protein n=1 Tax=Sorghum bicolor TaxID=4558 RepID=A0A921UNW3_SORBI|nr:hypothetical protein BDA96_03G287000 [Sorghum bicolor]
MHRGFDSLTRAPAFILIYLPKRKCSVRLRPQLQALTPSRRRDFLPPLPSHTAMDTGLLLPPTTSSEAAGVGRRHPTGRAPARAGPDGPLPSTNGGTLLLPPGSGAPLPHQCPLRPGEQARWGCARRRAKQEERCVANEKALADRKKALESRKIIFNHAKQYAREYKA